MPTLGSIKDLRDDRDHLYGVVVKPVPVPDSIDYEARMSPAKDQGERSACVAFATCGVKEYQRTGSDLSEEFIYDQVKQPGGGAMPRDAMKLLVKSGVCHEQVMPYDTTVTDNNEQPFEPSKHTTAFTDATPFKAKGYARIQTIDDLYLALTQTGPCLVAVNWLSGWFDPKTTLNGYPLLKQRQGTIAGGHALCACGYDKTKGIVKLKNSWSTTWGNQGYCYIDVKALGKHLTDSWSSYDLAA